MEKETSVTGGDKAAASEEETVPGLMNSNAHPEPSLLNIMSLGRIGKDGDLISGPCP